ncbi:MAG TPA: thiamine diphosphokinase [Candidatus Eisenbacteria bacterium]
MPTAVILANGTPPSLATMERHLSRASLFVCADGGANAARLHGLKPHAIVGDFDSVTPATLAHFADVPRVKDDDTERPDTEKALRYVLDRGPFVEIVLLGASAGRLDHVVGHVSLLRRYAGRAPLVLEDDQSRAWIASGAVSLDYPAGTVISFFGVGTPAEGVTTENLRFALRDRRLELGEQDSLSNVVTARPARITIGSGSLLVFVVNRP